ncbi:SMC-Scp complex subunit ScpB [Sphingobacterium sp. DK4209]|uniref:SMC-Scp complex subunit ScpB n=1 Tax=Sphingobacterium zhuxiongii TaxID=2662364 RepID=A0A5Q0Q972_9SPHI|nr:MULTISPECIES: SMC-Scp complex subunit ScpB [unclassified Sphingobacterium]MVZ65136.1 SMC-Scp complex subunit ScpB [Sphingobacterium sp. DK4209]QGA26083.1 SMC-Scp complex subunit ScpB [Sphingobacterium sp. dk4302]
MKDILLNIEAIIFASAEGISIQDLRLVLQEAMAIEINKQEIEDFVEKIKLKYTADDQVFELHNINEQYQFLTKAVYHNSINQLQLHKEKRKLSQAGLETLAIIAYRQPITKLEVEQIRGVNCDYTIQRLLDKGMISIVGKADSIGKPLLYATSFEFMQHFGLRSTKELPQLKDIVAEENSIGEIVE